MWYDTITHVLFWGGRDISIAFELFSAPGNTSIDNVILVKAYTIPDGNLLSDSDLDSLRKDIDLHLFKWYVPRDNSNPWEFITNDYE